MAEQTIICPRCDFEQASSDECLKCGVVFSKRFPDQADNVSDHQKRHERPVGSRVENTSGKGWDAFVPPDIRGWNWGAFFLNFLWAIGNRTWIGLLTIVPLIGLVMPFILGFKGNAWAWQHNRWENIEHFKRVQRKWAIWGVTFLLLFFAASAGLVQFMFWQGEPTSGEHVVSVDWLPKSATDISFYKVDGFGWIRNYDCLIPEKDFLIMAKKRGWEMTDEGPNYYYEKWHANGGGASVHYDKENQRLTVHSNHR